MMRSSRGVLPLVAFVSASTPSSASSASSSSVKSATCRLRLHAREIGNAFRHALFPRIRRRDRRQAPALLLEPQCPLRKLARLFGGEIDAPGRDRRLDLLETFLAHGL